MVNKQINRLVGEVQMSAPEKNNKFEWLGGEGVLSEISDTGNHIQPGVSLYGHIDWASEAIYD
jgi:hypothetical protein